MSDPSDTNHLTGTNPADTIDPNSSDASVARSVYANSLLMSGIYSWLPDMCDIKNRTLISKSGWEEAARVLFRRLRSSALVPLYDQSDPERIAQILGFVRVMRCSPSWIDIAGGVIVIKCPGHSGLCAYSTLVVPLTMFFNLDLLDVDATLTRRLVVEEQHTFGDQAIMIQSTIQLKASINFKQAPMIQVKGSSASSLRRIIIGKNDCEQIDHVISASILKAVRENVCNAQASGEEASLFAQLRSFESFAIHDITLETLSALLQRCPLLTRLAFSQHTLGNLPDILKTAPRLHDVEIKGAALSWLPSLTFIPRLSLECPVEADPETLEWMERTVVDQENVQARSQLRHLHLHVTIQFDIGNNYQAVARFILSLVPIDAEIVVSGYGIRMIHLRATIDSIRQEDKIAKEEQR